MFYLILIQGILEAFPVSSSLHLAFFNLKKDPNEQENLINEKTTKKKINPLLKNLYQERGSLIKKRMSI